MIFTKNRFEIWSPTQHPMKHSLADFGYSNPALPGVTNLETTINWFVSVLYPNTKASVANVAALPLVGNTINDYRVVMDDGDGKAASYRWEQREGEVTPSWHKVYDMDWGQDSILSGFLIKTQDVYTYKYGYDDLDGSGVPLTGITAGQHLYGGASANTHLTLHANSGDGVGPATGYIQFADNVRPTADDTINLGTLSTRFKDIHLSGMIKLGDLEITATTFTNAISPSFLFTNDFVIFSQDAQVTRDLFVDEALWINSNNIGLIGTSSVDNLSGFPEIQVSGAILNITKGGTSDVLVDALAGTFRAKDITAKDGLNTINMIADNGSSEAAFVTTQSMVTFGAAGIKSTGASEFNTFTATSGQIGNISLSGNTVSAVNANGNLIFAANGTGILDMQSAMTTLGQTVTGVMGITGQLNIDSLRLDGNVISSTALNADIVLQPNGTGKIQAAASILPSTDNTYDLGSASSTFKDIFFEGNISDGLEVASIATLLSLRDINSGVSAGMSIFWNGTKWVASTPDTEIDHSTITGLTTGDAGHTQFVMLAGRATGQTIYGGVAASEDLTLDSTSHATKGSIYIGSNLRPLTDASYSGGWSGIDLGGSTRYFRDVYTKGQFLGFRLENVTSGTLPTSSAQNIGRLVYTTDTKKIYVDDGTAFVVAGVGKFIQDTSWNGSDTSKTITVSASIQDARNAIWQLCDNANSFDRIFCSIKAISATQVTIEVNAALPAGSYRLIGLE